MTRILKPCLVLALMCAAIVGSRAQSNPAVFINEFHYDNAGTDLVRYRTGGTQYNRQYWGPPTSANMMRGSERTATWTVTIQ